MAPVHIFANYDCPVAVMKTGVIYGFFVLASYILIIFEESFLF